MTRAARKEPARAAALPPFRIAFESGKMAAREALNRFVDEVVPLDLDIEEVGTLELILAEVLNNIVEHAFPSDKPAGLIVIDCTHKRDGFHVQVCDRGKPMPDGQLPLGMMNSVDVELDQMPEGGFGWFLIRHLAKDVNYTRKNRTNLLIMRLAIGVGPERVF